MTKRLDPIHPGEVLQDEFLKPMGVSAYKLAKGIGVSQPTIGAILKKERGVTADMALLLGKFLGTSAEFWTNLQGHYSLELARDRMRSRLAAISRVEKAKAKPPARLGGRD